MTSFSSKKASGLEFARSRRPAFAPCCLTVLVVIMIVVVGSVVSHDKRFYLLGTAANNNENDYRKELQVLTKSLVTTNEAIASLRAEVHEIANLRTEIHEIAKHVEQLNEKTVRPPKNERFRWAMNNVKFGGFTVFEVSETVGPYAPHRCYIMMSYSGGLISNFLTNFTIDRPAHIAGFASTPDVSEKWCDDPTIKRIDPRFIDRVLDQLHTLVGSKPNVNLEEGVLYYD